MGADLTEYMAAHMQATDGALTVLDRWEAAGRPHRAPGLVHQAEGVARVLDTTFPFFVAVGEAVASRGGPSASEVKAIDEFLEKGVAARRVLDLVMGTARAGHYQAEHTRVRQLLGSEQPSRQMQTPNQSSEEERRRHLEDICRRINIAGNADGVASDELTFVQRSHPDPEWRNWATIALASRGHGE